MLKAVGFVIRQSVRKNGYIVLSSAITVTCITISKLIKPGGWARVIFWLKVRAEGVTALSAVFKRKQIRIYFYVITIENLLLFSRYCCIILR